MNHLNSIQDKAAAQAPHISQDEAQACIEALERLDAIYIRAAPNSNTAGIIREASDKITVEYQRIFNNKGQWEVEIKRNKRGQIKRVLRERKEYL